MLGASEGLEVGFREGGGASAEHPPPAHPGTPSWLPATPSPTRLAWTSLPSSLRISRTQTRPSTLVSALGAGLRLETEPPSPLAAQRLRLSVHWVPLAAICHPCCILIGCLCALPNSLPCVLVGWVLLHLPPCFFSPLAYWLSPFLPQF